jgi:hypothetical protein
MIYQQYSSIVKIDSEQKNANLSTAASERKKLKYSDRSTQRLAPSLAASTDCHIFG